jgi:hypothetical protein
MHNKTLFRIQIVSILSLLIICSCSRKEKQQQNEVDNEGWISLFDGKSLDNWEITNFGTQGPIQISQESILIGMGDGCSGINLKKDFPSVNYELSLQAKKVSGNDFFCGITFPVDKSYCSFIVGGWGGPVVGLSSIDDNDAANNETRILKKFEHDTWYNIHLKVTEKKIEAWIDEEQVVDFVTEGRKLSIRPEVTLSTPFGICTWMTTARIRHIRVRLLEN